MYLIHLPVFNFITACYNAADKIRVSRLIHYRPGNRLDLYLKRQLFQGVCHNRVWHHACSVLILRGIIKPGKGEQWSY